MKAVAFGGMDEETGGDGLRERLTRQGEDALGRLAQDLLENPLVNGAIARAFEAREKASAAQEVAFGALNLPSAADIERLTRRVRSVSQRLEGIEDGVHRLDRALASHGVESRLSKIEEQLGTLARKLGNGQAAPGKPPSRPAASASSKKASAKKTTAAKPARPRKPAAKRTTATSSKTKPRRSTKPKQG
jgi:type IV secretory pathway TrbL component